MKLAQFTQQCVCHLLRTGDCLYAAMRACLSGAQRAGALLRRPAAGVVQHVVRRSWPRVNVLRFQGCRQLSSRGGDPDFHGGHSLDDFTLHELSSRRGDFDGDSYVLHDDDIDAVLSLEDFPEVAADAGSQHSEPSVVVETAPPSKRAATPFLSRKRFRTFRPLPRRLVKQLDDVELFKATELQAQVRGLRMWCMVTCVAVAEWLYPSLGGPWPQALPHVVQGKDTVITAETGSGKTLCYVIPFLARRMQWLSEATRSEAARPRMLVVAPGHELCNQVADVIRSIDASAKVLVVTGKRKPQHKAVAAADVLIATPDAARRITEGPSGSAPTPATGNGGGPSTGQQAPFAMVVMDEADMLIGSFKAPLEAVLEATSGVARGDAQRRTQKVGWGPQHVFCAVRARK